MDDVPPELIETVQALAAEGLPVEQIAFMTHASTSLVREILDIKADGSGDMEPVNTTPDV